MTSDDATETATDDERDDAELVVVGIGASAGGLEALEALFSAAPPSLDVAWLVAVHLAPTRESLLAPLLQRVTSLNVEPATDGEPLEPGQVRVIPPGASMTVSDGTIRLTSFDPEARPGLAIDSLFRSLAADVGVRSVAIVLSGTGRDGTVGLRAVKGAGGMTMAQDESAKHADMPQSAIAAGLVDLVLPPERMPAALSEYVRRRREQKWGAPPPGLEGRKNALQQIVGLLKARTGHDFSHYKTTTLYRRIDRRVTLHHLNTLEEYVEHLKTNPAEARQLFSELLISVTSFFRDPEAFEALKRPHLIELLKRHPAGEPVRVWVPGCSTGEEAYSLAMVLLEVAAELDMPAELQIFATDIDEQAIEVARAGRYSDAIRTDVTEERLQRFFKPLETGGYQVRKMVREKLILAPQSVVKDPPFSKLDLVSCRNLLIYLDAELQGRVLATFHYALRRDGLLLLGSSETIGRAAEQFDVLNRQWKIFRRRALRATKNVVLGVPAHKVQPMPPPGDSPAADDPRAPSATQLMRAVLQQSETPACAVIDSSLRVVFVHGSTGRFLEPAEGRPSHDLLAMARPGLRTALGTCVRTAARNRQPAYLRGVVFQSNGDELTVDLVVRPVVDPPQLADLSVVFFERRQPVAKTEDHADAGENGGHEVLQRELSETRANLQSTIEELETANEELKSSNEELQSTNEELQSTNEELETSKEELQSLNEESTTVNAELQSRLEELMRSNDDLNNLLLSTGIATIFLDTELRVRRFTPVAAELFPLTRGDEGRPLAHFATSLVGVDVEALTQAMLDDLVIREEQVETTDGRRFVMKIRPYKTANNAIDGAVITFEDTTKAVHAAQATR